jgi:ABC-type lipoprotein release transport system permease subunit
MPLNLVRDFTTAEGLVTSVAINIDDKENMDAVATALTKTLAGTSLEVLKWTEMNKVLKQQIEGDNASGIIMLGILYMVIFFGILGTIIMMTSERIREFGVMTAVGMRRFKILIMMMLETILIGIIGLLAGVITTIPFIIYYMENPIRIGGEMAKAYEAYGIEPLLGFSGDPVIIINQFYTVLLLMVLTLVYPVTKIARLNIINALRG